MRTAQVPNIVTSMALDSQIFSDRNIFRSENLKPLRERGAGASNGEIDKGGNHPTPLGLIPQSPSGYRGFYTANLEAQGEVA